MRSLLRLVLLRALELLRLVAQVAVLQALVRAPQTQVPLVLVLVLVPLVRALQVQQVLVLQARALQLQRRSRRGRAPPHGRLTRAQGSILERPQLQISTNASSAHHSREKTNR